MTHYSQTAEALADAAESAIRSAHGRDWTATQFATNAVACRCGRIWDGPTSRKGLASHISATRRQADKAWTQTYDEAITRLRGF